MSMVGGSFGNCEALKPHRGRSPAKGAMKTPGPGHYGVEDPRKGTTTKFKTTWKPSFGGPLCKIDKHKTGYLREALTFKAPGPGRYAQPHTMGSQPDSRKPTASRMKFGTAPRLQGV